MGVTQYIGARYIPLFAEPLEWDNAREYEPLTIVSHLGNSYTSKQSVPKGIDIDDGKFWALTGNYNAQIEAYRNEVKTFDDRITANSDNIADYSQELAIEIKERKTADSTIEKDYKAADSAIEKDYKAADSAITSAYEKADNKTLAWANAINCNNAKLITRFMLGGANNRTAPYYGYGALQGGCIVTRANVDYWVCATNPNNNNHLIVINLNTHQVISDTIMNIGHGSTLSYNGKDTIIAAGGTDQLYIIDISNITNPTLIDTIATGSVIHAACFLPNSEKVATAISSADVGAYNFNFTGVNIHPNYNSLDIIENTIEFDFNSNDFVGWQGISTDGNYWITAFSKPECIVISDFETGETLRYVTIPKQIGHVQIDEIEYAQVIENTLYFSVFENLNSTWQRNEYSYPQRMASLFAVELTTNSYNLSYSASYEPVLDNLFTFDLYDPFTTFTSSQTTFYNRLINPTRYGFLFIDDAINIAETNSHILLVMLLVCVYPY